MERRLDEREALLVRVHSPKQSISPRTSPQGSPKDATKGSFKGSGGILDSAFGMSPIVASPSSKSTWQVPGHLESGMLAVLGGVRMDGVRQFQLQVASLLVAPAPFCPYFCRPCSPASEPPLPPPNWLPLFSPGPSIKHLIFCLHTGSLTLQEGSV